MNQEGMEDRYYFSDWGSCTCYDPDHECPLDECHADEDEDDDDE